MSLASEWPNALQETENMGLFDFFNSDESKKNEVALEIDIATGVLERCDVCRTVVDHENDALLPAAEAEAHLAFDNHDPRVAIFNGDREDLIKRLRSVREDCPYLCLCQDTG